MILFALGHRVGGALAVAVALVLFAVGIGAPDRAERIDRVAARTGDTLARGVMRAMSWIGWVLFVLPAWVSSRATGYDPLDAGWSTAGSAWTDPGHPSDALRSETMTPAGRMGTRELPLAPSARRRSRVRLAPLLVLLALGTWMLLERREPDLAAVLQQQPVAPPVTEPGADAANGVQTPPGAPREKSFFALEMETSYTSLPAYRGSDFADALQREQGVPMPDGNFSGRYVNVRANERVTTPRPDCECDRAIVWFSGGSAAWGEGQRDDRTIASQLVQLAERDGWSLEMRNLGLRGATFSNEVERIERLLDTEDPPDVIVVYNGWNDVLRSTAGRFVRGPDADDGGPWVLMPDLIELNGRAEEFLVSGVGRDAGASAARRYLGLQERLERAAAARGVEVLYYFQPDAFADRRQLEGYDRLTGMSIDELLGSPFATALDEANRRLEGRVDSLRSLFTDSDEPVFLGLVHQNERGAQVVAQRILPDLVGALRSGAIDRD